MWCPQRLIICDKQQAVEEFMAHLTSGLLDSNLHARSGLSSDWVMQGWNSPLTESCKVKTLLWLSHVRSALSSYWVMLGWYSPLIESCKVRTNSSVPTSILSLNMAWQLPGPADISPVFITRYPSIHQQWRCLLQDTAWSPCGHTFF